MTGAVYDTVAYVIGTAVAVERILEVLFLGKGSIASKIFSICEVKWCFDEPEEIKATEPTTTENQTPPIKADEDITKTGRIPETQAVKPKTTENQTLPITERRSQEKKKQQKKQKEIEDLNRNKIIASVIAGFFIGWGKWYELQLYCQ